MKLLPLIQNQKIMIDDHIRGANEIKNWDDNKFDVHIDKTTNYPIDGRKQNVRIKVPINSERPIKIENALGKKIPIPNKLKREILNAFEDKQTRMDFMIDVLDILKNFSTQLQNGKKLQFILNRISTHFGLKWTNKIITTYTNQVLEVYTQTYIDDDGNEYYITLNNKKLELGQSEGK